MTKEEANKQITDILEYFEDRIERETDPAFDKDIAKKDAEALRMAINALEQESKVGHWILADEQNKEDVENDNYRFRCSECQCSDIHAKSTIVPYCWKCGTRMVEPQESEDKE